MNKHLTLLAFTLAALARFTFAAENNGRAPERQPGSGRPNIAQGTLQDGGAAPDLALQDIEGKKTVKLSDLNGKPLGLVFRSFPWPPFVSSTAATYRLCST